MSNTANSTTPTTRRIALVTGGNRGIGLEVSRELAQQGFLVLLTARNEAKAKAAAQQLSNEGQVEPVVLDVADAKSIVKAAADVSNRYGHLDVLVNNAQLRHMGNRR